jgi:uncharacterized lipoprotein YmbA
VTRSILTPVLVLAAGCSSVSLPEENYYRLALPDRVASPIRTTHVLRIEGIELDSSLSRDKILVAQSDVQLQAYEFHRWISPLDRLIQDAITNGLSRSGAFVQVKGPVDGPGESLLLSGRVLDFQQVAGANGWSGKVTIVLRVLSARDRELVLEREVTSTLAMGDKSPGAAATALSSGLGDTMTQFLAGCAGTAVFAQAARPSK